MTKKYSELIAERKKEKIQNMQQSKIREDPEYLKKERSVNYVVKDGFFTSIKSGFTESFIMPFAIALSASNGMLAIINSVPQLLGSFFQLFSLEALKFFKTRSNLIFWSALIQAFMWLPLLIMPFVAKDQLWIILLFISLEVILGQFQGPIYNSILGDIVSDDKRGEFFGRRNRIVNLMNFISTFIAGFIITYFQKFDNGVAHYVFFGFAILFFIAFVSRVIAAFYKKKVYDPEFKPVEHNTSFIKFLKNMTHDNYGIFVMYVFLFKLAASISAPFFALYLLKDLSMGYVYFTIIMGASIAASFFAMTYFGKIIDRHGSKRVLTISGFLIPFAPLLMILAIYIKSPLWVFLFLLFEEILSGIVWAGFNLSTSAFLFDATDKEHRVKHISYYNFIVGIGIFLGSIIGALLIDIFPIWIISAIPFILLTSGILRMFATILFIRKVREARMVEIDFPGRGFFHNVLSINPRYGAGIEIVGVYHETPRTKNSNPSAPTKRTPVDPVKKDERTLYEKKSLEYYKNNALETLNQKSRKETRRDDSDNIEKTIEKERDNISKITEEIKKKNLK
ncbi:MAG: MFS transporter [Candidatus Woesearchaeota archaeon]